LTNSTSQYVRDWLVEKFRIIAVASLPQHTFAHVKAGVKSSILFLKKHPEVLTKQMESILSDIKAQVKEEKGLDKETKEERILELYKERIFKQFQDYKVKMFEVENIGYDAIGKKMEGSELADVAKRIRNFIVEEGL
jgi:type I restriction enzyme M protein